MVLRGYVGKHPQCPINRRQNGFHIGAFALYGYKKDPDQNGHLIIDEEAAVIVREVFTLFSQGP